MGNFLHENDKRNISKHKKMERRLSENKVNPLCKWAKNRSKRGY